MSDTSLAKILGYEEEDYFSLVNVVDRGLPSTAIDRLALILEISTDELRRYLPGRQRSKTLSSHVSDHLLLVAKVYVQSVETLENPKSALTWLKTPNYAFKNERPLDLVDTFAGAEMIFDELGRLRHGIFV